MSATVMLVAVLLALMIAASLVALRSTGVLSAIVAVGAVGFLTAIVFLLLGAPDLAIVQVGVEVVALAILIRAVSGRRADEDDEGARGSFVGRFGESVMDRVADAPSAFYLAEGLERTGAANIVSAVLLDFRGYDTLGEATVLFCAVLGAVTIARRRARVSQEPPRAEEAE
jgi:multisubunit Na+/H+ antiporter MnhB subunit